MKKSLLFLAAGVIAATAHGQQAMPNALFPNPAQHTTPTNGRVVTKPTRPTHTSSGSSTSRTTSGPYGRWYDYTAGFHNPYAPFTMYIDSMQNYAVGESYILSFAGQDLWQDTTDIEGYGNGSGGYIYQYNPFTTAGQSLDPQMLVWNEADSFAGDYAITNADAYTIDSVQILGWYNRDYSTAYKRGVVDTLVIAFVQGDPTGSSATIGDLPMYYFSSGSTYGISGDLNFVDMCHDSINNRAGHYVSGGSPTPLTYTGTAAGPVYKILLTSADTNGSNSEIGTTYPRPGRTDPMITYAVAAGNQASMSVSFKSGDTAAHPLSYGYGMTGMTTVGDTLRYINSTGDTIKGYKYGSFTMEYAFVSSDGTEDNAEVPPYEAYTYGDWTDGFFKREGPGNGRDGGWGGFYEPLWSWEGGVYLQYPVINFHTECSTCVLTGTPSLGVQKIAASNTVDAYPNPATDHLNISYTLVNSSEVTVTLSNMLGQVIATKKMANATSGNAIFNTNTLADGVYIYSFDATGNHSTGRVVVAH